MRYAFVSDIHANLQAWQAVISDFAESNVDQVICLGDVVGYGPRPAEVLASVQEIAVDAVLGNHDAVVANLLNPACFRPDAQRMIRWTEERLDQSAIDYFAEMPLTLMGGMFRCGHADFSSPGAFLYIDDEVDARLNWEAVPEQFLFIGHTHVPAIHVLDAGNQYTLRDGEDFVAQAGERYIINVGSVGLPRDGDLRSCYCILDTETASVTFRRVPFDVDGFRQDVESIIGYCEQAAAVLSQAREEGFSPAKHRQQKRRRARAVTAAAQRHMPSPRRRPATVIGATVLSLVFVIAAGLFLANTASSHHPPQLSPSTQHSPTFAGAKEGRQATTKPQTQNGHEFAFDGTVTSVVQMDQNWAVLLTVDEVVDGDLRDANVQFKGLGKPNTPFVKDGRYRVEGVRKRGQFELYSAEAF